MLRWSHCGPAALANCLWWFDSKFETTPIPPPTVNDQLPVGAVVRDNAAIPGMTMIQLNVMPFVDSLALYSGTNVALPAAAFRYRDD